MRKLHSQNSHTRIAETAKENTGISKAMVKSAFNTTGRQFHSSVSPTIRCGDEDKLFLLTSSMVISSGASMVPRRPINRTGLCHNAWNSTNHLGFEDVKSAW